MKITIQKGFYFKEALILLESLLTDDINENFEYPVIINPMDDACFYPILKKDMVVELFLKNEIGQISPNTEREFVIGEKEFEKLKEYKRWEANRFSLVAWYNYCENDCEYDQCIREVENDKKYIESAEEKKRPLERVEKRKKILEKHIQNLQVETEKKELKKKLKEVFEKNEVKYKYFFNLAGECIRTMIFELEKTFIFSYYAGDAYSGHISVKEDEKFI